MYVDDAVILTRAKNIQEACSILKSAVSDAQDWFSKYQAHRQRPQKAERQIFLR